jgi:ABC-type lipoprotein release transport system permease subunit
MRHWSQIATRNWRVKRVRTLGAVLAIALGTAVVVWVTCCYESVRQTVSEWAGGYLGASHINIESAWGKYDTLPERLVTRIESVRENASSPTARNIQHIAPSLVQRMRAAAIPAAELESWQRVQADWLPSMDDLDVHGIDLDREFQIRDWNKMLVAGRMLTSEDRYACVLEVAVAHEEGVGVGDYVLVWPNVATTDQPQPLEIVGLIERRRIARFLKGVALVRLPVLQEVARKFALVNSVDIVLADVDRAKIAQAAQLVYHATRPVAPNAQVRSAAARQAQLEKAQEQQEVVLILMSCVAMLTALFIILSTLSMGLVERVGQMGLLRCTGATRLQLAWLTVTEVVPLGLVGIVLGVPIGLALTLLTTQLVPEYVGSFVVSYSGIGLAILAGFGTVVAAALLPAWAAATIAPLEATRPRARTAGVRTIVAIFLVGVVLVLVQHYVVQPRVQRDLRFVYWSSTAVVLLYLVYALAAPFAVWVVSRLAVPVVAGMTAVRSQLLQDQVGRAVWRSAGIICGLMVGLSLIVSLVVFNASFRSGWQFPKQFPEAYLWSFEQIRGDVEAQVAAVPGIRNYTVANAPNVIVEERLLLADRLVRSLTYFLGVNPDSFFDLVQLKFIEGDEQEAIAKLREGGYVLVSADFARARRKGVEVVYDEQGGVLVSNEVRIWFNKRWTTFEIAGVVDSPALDIAASYFQVQSEARVAATGSVIGTNADLKKHYGIEGAKLVLLNFDLPPEQPPADWPPPRDSAEGRRLAMKYYNENIPLDQRWQNYREEYHVLQGLARELDAPLVYYGTARELKDEIDAELNKITYLLTAVPAVALLVAAIGVANLMTANVASRTKQIAVMRAVGATRGLVLRMVVGEALVLGVLGSALGLGLGMHLASSIILMTDRMWGYALTLTVPWGLVLAAVGLTVGLCVIAGILPARHAARTNVIDALHVN